MNENFYIWLEKLQIKLSIFSNIPYSKINNGQYIMIVVQRNPEAAE